MDITEGQNTEEASLEFAPTQIARGETEAIIRRTAFLAEASKILCTSLDFPTILRNVVRIGLPAVADLCLVYILEPEDSSYWVEVAHTDPAKEELVRAFAGLRTHLGDKNNSPVRVLRSIAPVLIPELSHSDLASFTESPEQLSLLDQLKVHSAMVAPLESHGHFIGALCFFRSDSEHCYKHSDIVLAEDLASRAALAIENAFLYRESQAANHAKDEFLAMVSHELRTPLNSILGWARMLQSGRLDTSLSQRGLEIIERNVKAQVQLIDDLLDISRIIRGKLRLTFKPVKLGPIIEAALDLVRPLAVLKGIELASVLDQPEGTISGDSDRLQQVIWNLLTNAIKFTPANGKVTVRLQRVQSHLQVSVSDTGRGIDPEFLPYVFERFRQATSGIARSHGGLGLGLAIVRHLVEMHGGTARAESPGKGQGSIFTLDFPIRAILLRAEDSETSDSAQDLCSRRLEGTRVLVIDDEADARELVSMVLQQYGAEVSTADSVAAAIQALDEKVPNILVCDIGMPEEDGYSLISRIRSRSPDEGGKLPAIALTAFTMPRDREKLFRAGFQMHVPKPVEPVDLVNAIALLTGAARAKAHHHQL